MRARIVLGALALAGALVGASAWGLRARTGLAGPHGEPEDTSAPEPDVSGALLAAHLRTDVPSVHRHPSHGRLRGSVRRGKDSVSARVELYELALASGATTSRIEGGDGARVPTPQDVEKPPVRIVSSDAGGRFDVDRLPAGTYDLVARSPDGGLGRARAALSVDAAVVDVRIEIGGVGAETVRGRARYADGRPFDGIVSADLNQTYGTIVRGLPTTTCDADGRFSLSGLDRSPITLIACKPGVLIASSETFHLPREGEIELVVDAGLSDVSARVVDDGDGRPIRGAIVEARSWPHTASLGEAVSRAVSDADGRFVVRASSRTNELTVSAVGYADLRVSRSSSAQGVELRLLRTGRVIGRVRDADGTPVPDVDVHALHEDDEPARTLTDSDGRYRLDDVRPGDLSVVALGGGWMTRGIDQASDRFDPLSVPLAPGATITVDLVVVRAVGVTGVVLDAAATPVDGARVRAVRKAPGGRGDATYSDVPCETSTDASGRFAFDSLVPGSSYAFRATAAGRADGTAGPIRAGTAPSEPVEIRLRPGRTAEVVVRELGGTPMPGIWVRASSASEGEAWSGERPTGADGIARLEGLPAGPIRLSASAETMQGKPVTVGEPAGSVLPIRAEILVEPRLAISGVVRDADGVPYDGVVVAYTTVGRRTGVWVARDGAFRMSDLARGNGLLEVKADDAVLLAREVVAGDEGLELVVTAKRPPRLVVELVDSADRPVAGGRYSFKTVEGSGESGPIDDGFVRLDVPTAEWYLLASGARSASGTPLALGAVLAGPFPAGATSAKVRWGLEHTIEGSVRSADGAPVRGARVAASFTGLAGPFADEEDDAASTRSDERGRFRLGGLAEGVYRLGVTVGGAFGAFEPVDVRTGTPGVVLTLRSGAAVQPVIVDADGKPVALAYVVIDDGGVFTDADTDGEGRAVLDGLDPRRTYTLQVRPPASRGDVLARSVEGWTPSNEPIALERGWSVAGIVRAPDGGPAALATVRMQTEDDESESTRTDARGAFEITRLRAGPVTLTAEGASGGRSRPLRATAGSRGLTLSLAATDSIDLTIVSDLPLGDDAWVCCIDTEDARTFSRASGPRVRLAELDAGSTYTIVVRTSPDDPTGGLVGILRDVRPGANDVRLTLAPARWVSGRVRIPQGATSVKLHVTDAGWRRDFDVDEDGRFVVGSLVEGDVVVVAEAEGPAGEELSAKATVQTGGTLDLDLQPTR